MSVSLVKELSLEQMILGDKIVNLPEVRVQCGHSGTTVLGKARGVYAFNLGTSRTPIVARPLI